ncbi:MAG: tetratricopeptide repeat protein [Bacteroidota bacterium]|nr:tetratricopeptide repeat protein [Bacteroidota bacterium]
MRLLLTIFVLCFVTSVVISCKPSVVTKEEQEKADSLNIRLNSAELKTINAQLLENPSDPDLYIKRCQLYIQYKQFEVAAGDAKRAIRLDSTVASYYIALGDVYFAENKTRQTKEVLERTVVKFPESTEALMKLSELYFIVKQYKEAIENINKALKINENIAKAYYLKGSIYRESGDTSKAISSLETAVEQDNRLTDAYYDLGIIYAARKNPIAFDYYANALRVDPGYVNAQYAKAKLLQDVGKFDEAISEYMALLNKDKNYLQANYNIGAIYLDVKSDYPKAIEYLNKALEQDNQWAAAYFARGYSYAKMGNKLNAADDYKKCLAIEPNFTEATVGLRQLN